MKLLCARVLAILPVLVEVFVLEYADRQAEMASPLSLVVRVELDCQSRLDGDCTLGEVDSMRLTNELVCVEVDWNSHCQNVLENDGEMK